MINVNGIEWNIRFVNPNDSNLMRSDGSITLGVTDNNTRTVYINNCLSEYMYNRVITHEMCHVFSFSYGCDMDIQTEEIVADFLSLYGRDVIKVADSIIGDVMRYIG